MEEMFRFTPQEAEEVQQLTTHLHEIVGPSLQDGDQEKINKFLQEAAQKGIKRDVFGLHPVLTSLQTACIIVDEIGLRRDGVIATMPDDERNALLERNPQLKADWDNKYGDRMQKIVFIGQKLDRAAIEAQLDKCLEE